MVGKLNIIKVIIAVIIIIKVISMIIWRERITVKAEELGNYKLKIFIKNSFTLLFDKIIFIIKIYNQRINK